MQAATPTGDAWSRWTWGVVTVLTGLGLFGILVAFASFFAVLGPLRGGCAFGGIAAILMLVAGLVVLVYLALVGLLALLGVIFFWRRSRWGPRLLIPSNLLSMVVFYLSPFSPDGRGGHAEWAVALVLFAVAPAVAAGLLLWALQSSGSWKVRIVELAVLAVIAVPSVSGWFYGLEVDFAAALAPTPPPVAAAPGCTAPAPVALTRP